MGIFRQDREANFAARSLSIQIGERDRCVGRGGGGVPHIPS
ncbi:hypothetical protein DAD186_20630 [Dermabacter vaginalis]|uniref:Uncharacterized protein n=1 Tax=Dermabacter vaginalis TaxID=1630135 RepID=A0A1B0ZL11_9MICO|nr:hypothetical protein DAD186_20630 [Dermabacter vaginalis]